ncbi:conserved uncharacterized protein [Desulfococcus multivorans]|nr:conserved uncharacterized protein [Desulfococcus multivorans]
MSFIRTAVIENAIEAQVVSNVLRQEDIPHELRSYHDTAYDGLFQMQLGWGELRTPEVFREQVLDILREIRGEN